MTDQNLIAAGCGVAFIALCGVYVYLRDRLEHGTTVIEAEVPLAPVPVKSR
jgi:hypothetical protein